VVALTWARFSTKVLDEDTASEILGAPVVSELPHYRSLARHPLAAFQALPRSAVPVIDQLCVLAEAKARLDHPLAVVAVGTQRSAGATTLALAMAERFAIGGSSVVLVDADVRDPRITAIFNATADGGVPSVVANDGALIDQRGRSVFTRTMDPEVSVLGLGASRSHASLRRDTVASVLEAARRKAQIVVVDGGPALDLASTLQLTTLADAVVLAVPLSRQKSDLLADLSRQLGDVRDKLLPVVTSPARRAARGATVASDGAIAMPGLSPAPPPVDLSGQPSPEAPAVHAPPAPNRETAVYGQGTGSGGPPPPGP
jgi:receptor protein-tyrosine kinase